MATICDICGSLIVGSHLCPSWALEDEIARTEEVVQSLLPFQLAMGLDEHLDQRLAGLEEQLEKAYNAENAL